MAFSATLARINRTFLSTTYRRESRGGSAIFSIYRYKVARTPVELPLWDQFARRFARLLEAKAETNRLVGGFYRDGDTPAFHKGSATDLLDFVRPGSIDYIYTDPPYGGHIAYLDLSTMWAAWLGFDIKAQDRAKEVIEGGDLRKSRDDYQSLLARSLEQMHEALKDGGWLSVVFAHRDTTYWDGLVDACRAAGFAYANTVVQPVGVVWSMHKKKNPLRVLSGELVLNFRRKARPAAKPLAPSPREAAALVRACCEAQIVQELGASTEALHHAVVPKLLEAGLLREFSREHGDLIPLLTEWFEFDPDGGKWHLRSGSNPTAALPRTALARYHIACLLTRGEREGKPPTEAAVNRHVCSILANGRAVSRKTVRRILLDVGYSPDRRHWRPGGSGKQREFFFSE
jgi:hypothetical protein